jgi:cytochrome c peroxidase
MRRRRAAAAGLLSVALALGGAACGDGGDGVAGAVGAGGAGGGVPEAGGGGAGIGAGGEAPYEGPPIPWPYAPFPELPASAEPVTPERAELGRLLFYDPILSGDRATACVTCHSEQWGLGDGLSTSIGIGGDGPVGPGRVGDVSTRRNAPTLWNVAYREALFWDGRSDALEAQALEPLRDPIELGLDPDEAAARVREVAAYRELFAAAFPGENEPVTAATIARALAALERTFVSRRAPYDQYVGGDAGALDDASRRGMELFAEAGCASCHAPPLFASGAYEARGIGDVAADEGRAAISGAAADRGAFRVPTLRNVRDTEPYFHDGSVTTLEDAVAHEVAVQVDRGASRALEEGEVAAIVRFVKKALQDTSQAPERPRDVPSGLPIPEDGFRIPR